MKDIKNLRVSSNLRVDGVNFMDLWVSLSPSDWENPSVSLPDVDDS